MVFSEHKSGLHVYKPPTKRKVKGLEQVVFINTVRENMKAFTKRKINRGRRARRLSDTLFPPSDTYLKWICQSNPIRNNTVIPEDADIAYNIWGKNVKALVGKGTKQPTKHVDDHKFKIPREFEKLKKSVLIVMDILFVNGIPFFYFIQQKYLLYRSESLTWKVQETDLPGFQRTVQILHLPRILDLNSPCWWKICTT